MALSSKGKAAASCPLEMRATKKKSNTIHDCTRHGCRDSSHAKRKREPRQNAMLMEEDHIHVKSAAGRNFPHLPDVRVSRRKRPTPTFASAWDQMLPRAAQSSRFVRIFASCSPDGPQIMESRIGRPCCRLAAEPGSLSLSLPPTVLLCAGTSARVDAEFSPVRYASHMNRSRSGVVL
ncbi:hypothetical protein BU26DRAFT_321283 [Trematosphaeria pertusa]|uniref:Uncharacterized protein n=1 Tax=Trematosphaeria pertusa TaxID=390896 RepID=A0A6A6IBM9_9PLEO|nr:uncharacterized protein BU26DRAFT_321283 [Trematosphaeria pertusa]KAF2247816.1 hypothetical protein BU26DRAFT_321283 [Trematosphaeria pertusa]